MTEALEKLIHAAQDAVEMLREDGNRYTANQLESPLAAARAPDARDLAAQGPGGGTLLDSVLNGGVAAGVATAYSAPIAGDYNVLAMRKTTRDEKIVRPGGVYEVPYTSFETWFKSVQKYIEPQDMEQWLNAAFDAGRAGVPAPAAQEEKRTEE
jgi:hypothetical protein